MKRERESGIELLKIIAILLIIISHVTQTVSTVPTAISLPVDYYINLNVATTDISMFILALFRYFGPLGNIVFFVCSAWFLCNSKKTSKEKILQMLIDIWIISVLFLLITLLLGVNISPKYIIKSLFPTIFGNNWYLTCYLIFYVIHGYINMIIDKMSQKMLLTTCLLSTSMYCGICFLEPNVLFYSSLVLFFCIYTIINYMRKYMSRFSTNKSANMLLLCFGCVGWIGVTAISNLISLKFGLIDNPLLRWSVNQNPFLIAIAISLFNLFKAKTFINRKINQIAGLSLFVYLFHENIIFRDYIRPYVFVFVYEKCSYKYILMWIILISFVLFLVSVIISYLYCVCIQRQTKRIEKIAYRIGSKFYKTIIDWTMKVSS